MGKAAIEEVGGRIGRGMNAIRPPRVVRASRGQTK